MNTNGSPPPALDGPWPALGQAAFDAFVRQVAAAIVADLADDQRHPTRVEMTNTNIEMTHIDAPEEIVSAAEPTR
jgi:hypothetical protein